MTATTSAPDVQRAMAALGENSLGAVADYDGLVDPLTGLVIRVREHPAPRGLSPMLRSFVAHGANAERIGPWPADRVGGADGIDPEACRRAAIGEYLERYCGNYVQDNLVRASWRQLADRGLAAIDPAELALYSDSQYQRTGFPFEPFTRDLEVNWTAGVSLISGESVLVPASMVWVNYFYGRYRAEPATNFHMFSGLAAGPGIRAAATAGLRELLERDATMMWWLNHYDAPIVNHRADPLLNLLTTPLRGGLTWTLIEIPSEFGAPVAGALLVDEEDGIAGMGFGCRSTWRQAFIKAIAEASQMHNLAWAIKDPDGLLWRAMRKGVVHDRTLKPYRADLRYLDDFDPQFRDVTDLAHQSQIFLDRRLWPVLQRITGSQGRSNTEFRDSESDDSLAKWVGLLASRGIEPVCVDVTTREVRERGFAVVRVIAPGLLPNAPAGFPFLGGQRLYEVPVQQRWQAQASTASDLNLAPLPHS